MIYLDYCLRGENYYWKLNVFALVVVDFSIFLTTVNWTLLGLGQTLPVVTSYVLDLILDTGVPYNKGEWVEVKP